MVHFGPNKIECYQTLLVKPPSEKNSSSTKPELYAILRALTICNPTQVITIKTDSQSAIDGILTYRDSRQTNRRKIKLDNSSLLHNISLQMDRFDITPTITKLKPILTYRLMTTLINSPRKQFYSLLPKYITLFQSNTLHIQQDH
jgi:hypothetical protein